MSSIVQWGKPVLTAWFAALAFLACGRSAPEPPQADPGSRRVTRSGEVVGFRAGYGSHAWLGIPYAAPPTALFRWRAPRPPEPWDGTRAALSFGSPCVQYASAFGGVTSAKPGEPVGNEDCLYLNIWAPPFPEDRIPKGEARLPVMVWIHGGGNSIGEGGFYNGGNLAATQNLIVITLNYRLGPLGWLRHAALRTGDLSDEDRSGNFGTLDLIRALQWTRDNIAGFGGDPDNVTIFGESAGGVNVYSLLLSPLARGLFHRAIVQSGSLRFSAPAEAEAFREGSPAGHENSSNEMLVRLLVRDGVAADRASAKSQLAKMDASEVEGYLRGKNGFEILTAYPAFAGTGMIQFPDVFRDGAVLPSEEPVERLARADGYNRVPVMLGTTRDENKLFMYGDPYWVRKILWFIPRLRDERMYNSTASYLARMWKAQGADEPAAVMRATQGPSVFVYRFDWDEEPRVLGADLSVMLGAAHGFEIPFVFGHFDLGKEGNIIFTDENEPGRKELSAAMMSYWAEFAYSGSPGRGRKRDLPQWNAWDASGTGRGEFVVLDTSAGGGIRRSEDVLTTHTLLAAVDEDPDLSTQRHRCMIFRALANWSNGLTRKEYPKAGRNGCAEYPFDGYPWND